MLAIVRLFVVALVLGIITYAGMLALVRFVEPEEREMSSTVQPSRFNR